MSGVVCQIQAQVLDQKECTLSPGGGISAAPCGSWACAIASGLKLYVFPNVRYWHKADMLNALTNVRFWGQSGRLGPSWVGISSHPATNDIS